MLDVELFEFCCCEVKLKGDYFRGPRLYGQEGQLSAEYNVTTI